ncbi:alpha-lytic protease prodomain-containing protein [Nonomuraea ferruginea]
MADPATPPSVIDALERDLGLTERQVVTRLANEQRAAATEATLTASLGDSYGGSWLNADASKLMVATTDAAEAPAIEAKGAQPVVVGRTLAQLTSVKDQLDLAAQKGKTGASLWYVDVTTNSVVILAATQEAGEALAAAAGVDKGVVKVAVSTESPQPFMDIIGGSAFYIGSSRCSVGFSVTRGSTPGFVTAQPLRPRQLAHHEPDRHLPGLVLPRQRLRLGRRSRPQRHPVRARLRRRARDRPRLHAGVGRRVHLPLRLHHRLALRHHPAAQRQRPLRAGHRLRPDPHQRVRPAGRLRRLVHLRQPGPGRHLRRLRQLQHRRDHVPPARQRDPVGVRPHLENRLISHPNPACPAHVAGHAVLYEWPDTPSWVPLGVPAAGGEPTLEETACLWGGSDGEVPRHAPRHGGHHR